MTPDLLHKLWELIETVPTHRLLRLNQQATAELLIQKLRAQQPLTTAEEAEVRNYVAARITLIQELAQLRQGKYCLLPAYI